MKQSITNVRIIGTGSYLPETVITNKDLEARANTADAWVYEKLGIRERRIVTNELTSDLAAKAALNALKSANLSADEIDLIIVATSTPDRLAPSTACIVQDKIKAYKAVAFDLAAVCSGFLYAYSTASQFVSNGIYKNVLVIGADTFSKIVDWDRRDCVFFGDGAGAVVLSRNEENDGFLRFRLYSDGRGKSNFTIPGGGAEYPISQESHDNRKRYFEMNGSAVFETAVSVLPNTILEVLDDAQMSINDVSLLVPHQPSIRILKETARKIGMPFDKVMINMEKYANTSGGTIPIVLDETYKSGKIKPGDFILFAAVGSGWTWGAALLKWN
ncbi:beta-ketoacyl-ACP synthase III [Pontibacter indicus]|uniref:Beta-ketoacyl-[acyl-carrier-protein] synthase III n=1 Tax=Pontibacter indicus TaxID=1317125 RepID=A0A1R3XPE3_9BACT|nr:beta-ketoacyl-ACP synthase III [Pontibacter indicus]SIT93820.1 3-oxoacyl-[acyl-carrier-protein] synthase-3 [Pontibacter indicus]